MNCETDFVARTDDFRRLLREVVMQIAASDPRWIGREDVPEDVVSGERKIYEDQARATGKPGEVIERIAAGKIEAFYKQTVLLDQAYIRDDSKTVGELVKETGAKVGENVVVRRFSRFALGKD